MGSTGETRGPVSRKKRDDSTKRKRRERKPKAISQRRPEIREYIKQYLDDLVSLYEKTDPALGDDAEYEKLERARQAISIWWYLYAELMLWAQSHLAGYETLKSNPELRERIEKLLGSELTVDSHALEYVGVYFSWNHVDDDDPMLCAIHEIMGDEFKLTMEDPPLRHIIRELLVSRSANSSFWRFPLQHAFFALELGEVDDLVKPSEVRRQGDPLALYSLKLMALTHAHFLMGKGTKKYIALNKIGEAVGQSVETLRSWEKIYLFDDDAMMKLRVAELAGALETELDTRTSQELTEEYGAEYFRHSSNIEYAKLVLKDLRDTPLDQIKNDLRDARLAKSGG